VFEIGSIGTFVTSALNNASAAAVTWASVSAPMASERTRAMATDELSASATREHEPDIVSAAL